MWCFLLVLLILFGGASRGASAEGMEYLALRGGLDEPGTEFNDFRGEALVASRPRLENNRGYIAWKNRCIRVSRMAAGASFEFGGDSGFSTVAPYVRVPEPPAAGFIECLVEELSTKK